MSEPQLKPSVDRTPPKFRARQDLHTTLRRRCEARVSARRQELFTAMRCNSAAAEDILNSIVEEEVARGGVDDEEEGMTAEERLALLLHLQETLYAPTREKLGEGEDEVAERMARELDEEERALEDKITGAGYGERVPSASLALPEPIRAAFDADAAVRDPRFGTAPNSATRSAATAASDVELLDEDDMDALVAVSSVSRARELHESAAAADARSGSWSLASSTLPRADAAHGRLPATDVSCPMCRKLPLYEFRRMVACRCGFYLDTAGGFSIDQMRDRLAEIILQHKELCGCEPVLQVVDLGGTRTLMASCPRCHDLSVVM